MLDATMPHATTSSAPLLRTRALGAGHLRAFLAVARHLNFRAAADELALTQSAVSRQIQSLEDEVGVPLFLRHSRAVELTGAGAQLLHAVQPALESIDGTVRQIRQTVGRKSVAITTWASFAAMWLIPRLEAFQRSCPDIDIRIDTGDAVVDLDTTDVDLAIRYSRSPDAAAQPLFEEELVVVGAELASDERGAARLSRLIAAEDIARLEQEIDHHMAATGPLKAFVIPGKTLASAQLHVARTQARQIERTLVAMDRRSPLREALKSYMNRLSDALFAMARFEEGPLTLDADV